MKARKGIACLTILGIMVLVLSLMGSGVRAENPPLEGHFMGPALIANITFKKATPAEVLEYCWYEVNGEIVYNDDGVKFRSDSTDCMGQTFSLEEWNLSCCADFTFDEISKDSLKGFMFNCEEMPSWVPERCAPDGPYDGLFIQTVLQYSETSTVKTAKVIMLFVVP